MSKLRNSGLSVLGDIPWGTHFSLGYKTEQDLIETVSSYFRFGLAANEGCLWMVDKDLGLGNPEETLRERLEKLDDHVREGRLEIKTFGFRSLNPPHVDPEMLLNALQCKVLAARAIGLSGLRLCITAPWPIPELWGSYAEYKRGWDRAVGELEVLAMYTIPLEGCSAEQVTGLSRAHERSVVVQNGDWSAIEAISIPESLSDPRSSNPNPLIAEKTLSGLTSREKLVLSEILKGHSSKKVAQSLGLSPRTVEFHRANILQKLGVDSTVKLVRLVLTSSEATLF